MTRSWHAEINLVQPLKLGELGYGRASQRTHLRASYCRDRHMRIIKAKFDGGLVVARTTRDLAHRFAQASVCPSELQINIDVGREKF